MTVRYVKMHSNLEMLHPEFKRSVEWSYPFILAGSSYEVQSLGVKSLRDVFARSRPLNTCKLSFEISSSLGTVLLERTGI